MIRRKMLAITGGAAVFPLVVLFGLNAVDELDRTAFAVLLPISATSSASACRAC